MKKQSVAKDFQFMKKNFFVRLITYPLNLIPFAGAALYSAINGTFVICVVRVRARRADNLTIPPSLYRLNPSVNL